MPIQLSGKLTAFTFLALAGVTLYAQPPAKAQTTVYSSFGAGNSFDNTNGYIESGDNTTVVEFSAGSAFTVSQSGALSSITAAYSNVSGTNIGHLYLTDSFADLGNTSAALEGFTFTSLPVYPNLFIPEVLTSTRNPILSKGTTYYLYGLETGDTNDTFNFNDQGLNGTRVESSEGDPYTSFSSRLPAFSIQVTPSNVTTTPEPASCTVFAIGGLGLLGLGLKARKRR